MMAATIPRRMTAIDITEPGGPGVLVPVERDTRPAMWATSPDSKQRTTWAMARVSRMPARNRFPRPSPFDAPATSPAMSTNSIAAGTTRPGRAIAAMRSRRGSGTGTTPTLGSIVQKG